MTLGWDDLHPFFGLTLRAGDGVELRYVDDDLLPALATVAAEGIHDPSWQPLGDWADVGDLERGRSVAQHVWRTRAALTAEQWDLSFAVLRDGVVVGRQDLQSTRFAVTREVSTGSWLGQAHQGRGTGSLMRLAVLSLAFDHLRAGSAVTSAYKDNRASARVSHKAGYLDDGDTVEVVRGQRREGRRFRMTAERWRDQGHPQVAVDGLTDQGRALLGAG
ncbi:GNAT family N-acetyltransferase [Aquipuribacter sp. MA13-6]|uniref:GNAT family N-acetyltransferase n=1 Tax=unclassified Aquipuribacter TaxID=2635084 RepID=UPI003EEE1270